MFVCAHVAGRVAGRVTEREHRTAMYLVREITKGRRTVLPDAELRNVGPKAVTILSKMVPIFIEA